MPDIRDKILGMGSAERDVMWQLFRNGPTWDGDISSKSGRDELFDAGLASRVNGWSFLTEQGMEAAVRVHLMGDRKECWQDARRRSVA